MNKVLSVNTSEIWECDLAYRPHSILQSNGYSPIIGTCPISETCFNHCEATLSTDLFSQ